MAITPAQRAAAEQRQWQAAQDAAPQVRLVAGPGTGKSKTIEKRVATVLNNGATARNVYAISFTVAASTELRQRITAFCASQPCAAAVADVHVSTMHSLALRILRVANILATLYPSNPGVLDDWERVNVYEQELAGTLGCSPTRASEIRLAHDAAWQTLNPQFLNQAAISQAERTAFTAFHAARTNLYCCVLPGEVVYKCVDSIRQGSIQQPQLPAIEHLIVDEFQDLNACDQQFIWQLTQGTAVLFIAGDDDQSIYSSLRHADPSGIVNFPSRYPNSRTHILNDVFRCTPNVLNPASAMIVVNPNRVPKNPVSLYQNATPPVMGRANVWSFASEQDEANAVASSCQQLLNAGMSGQEDQIVILISDRGLQLNLIAQALGNLGLPYEQPRGEPITNDVGVRAVYCILRVARDLTSAPADYVAHRSILALLSQVGAPTAKGIGDACIANNQNFRDLFYVAALPHWLNTRQSNAVTRVRNIVRALSGWSLSDTVAARSQDVANTLGMIFAPARLANATALWNAVLATVPGGMTLEELLGFFSTDNELDREAIINAVNQRLGAAQNTAAPVQPKRIRILTMHGAKGLSGKVVFIPSVEQGIMPSFRAIQATGLLLEQRRLFYVSVTRAMAACIVSHAALHVGASAFRLQNRAQVRLPRSQFLNEMGVPSVNRTTGLAAAEAAAIVADVGNL